MTLALYGKSRKRRGALLLTAFLAVLAATLGGLALIGTAFAHTAVVTGIATCNADGTWNIAWTVNNDETSGRATYGTVALSNISVDSGTPPTLSPLTLQVFGTTGYVPATGTQSNIPGSATSVTLKVTGTWSDGQVYTDQGTVSFPSNCSKITVKKVVTGIGSSASDVFGVNIQNTGGGTGDNSNAQISQNTPYTETVAVDGSKDLFTFNENTPLPTGYALSKVAVLDGNNKTCPSSLTSSTWGNPGNPNDASKNLSAGSNVTVCFLNTYTAPTGFITISEGACTANTAGSWAFHFIAPNTSANSSDTITVKYHYNGELVDAHITTQVENGSGAKDNWHVTIPFGSFSSITIDHATDTAGDSWDGVNGLANAVIQSSLCQPEVGAPGVSKTQDATPFDATNAYWDITVNNSANNVALTGFTVTDAGTTLVSATGGTCTTVGAGSPFTCTVAAQGTVVIKVSKPLAPSGGVFDACKGVTLDNNAITVTGLPQGVPAVTTITYTNTQIVVAPDTTKCTPPTITKTGTTPTTGVPSWTILVTNPTAANDGITRKVIITDAGVTAASPVLTGGATCTNTGNITSTGITCTMPAGSTVSIKVTPASAPTRQCLDTTFNNTANLYIDSTSNTPITGVGTTITLTGDQTKCGLPTIVKGADVSETSGQPTWTINVTNPDAGQGIQRTVVVKDATASLVSTNTTSGSVVCTGTDITVAGVSCVMSAGSSVEFHVTAFPVVTQTCAPQQFTNTVSMTVDGGSPITANADNTITVTGNPALCASTTFDKTDSLGTPPTVNAGTPFTWTMKATVSGSATTAAQTFSDTIPNTFLIVSVTPNDASITCAAPVASGGDNIITCTLHSAAAVGDHTVAVNVLPGAGACGPFTNTVNDVQGAVLASDRQITVNCDQQVTFIKYICPTTSDIPANPPFGTAVTDAAGKCTRATTPWVFNLGTSDGGSQFGTATTSSTGETTITLSTAELTKALNAYPNGIHVSEVVQTGFTLG